MDTKQAIAKAKRAAYATAKKHGCTIEVTGERTWTAQVSAPEGKLFNGDTSTLVSAHYYTAPDVAFWTVVRLDIENNAQFLEG